MVVLAADLIRSARREAGLSLRELARRAGTSDATISAYEHGRVVPRVDTLVRIVEAAGKRLEPRLASAATRDPRRAPVGEELWQVLLLADALPQRTRADRPTQPHAVFGP